VALRLLEEKLSPDTKPTEKEARVALRKVLWGVTELLFEIDKDMRKDSKDGDEWPSPLPEFGLVLTQLALAIDPAFDPKGRLAGFSRTRKINFGNSTQGSATTRAAHARRLDIAFRVRELRDAGAKAPVRQTADEFHTVSTDVSRICKALRSEVESLLDDVDDDDVIFLGR
jgi:hypothetical protein